MACLTSGVLQLEYEFDPVFISAKKEPSPGSSRIEGKERHMYSGLLQLVNLTFYLLFCHYLTD